ncbi:hypothetical protein OQ968_14800 [Mycobacterium sp. 663a-19]|nr:hypothetical protein [Mycobacterium sp. 663a-19]MEB3982530.1 hypothetical protein [Mycobacterium sp. 663a-19]
MTARMITTPPRQPGIYATLDANTLARASRFHQRQGTIDVHGVVPQN